MSSVVIAGDTSGSVTLQAPAVAGTTVLTLPSTSGTLVTSAGALTLLATLTPTAAANVDALTTFTSSYDNYVILIDGVTSPAGGGSGQLYVRFANAGVVDTTSVYRTMNYNNFDQNLNEAFLNLTFNGSMSFANGRGYSGLVNIWNANATDSTYKGGSIQGVFNDNTATGTNYAQPVTAYIAYRNTAAISGVRFYWSGGTNFSAQGKIRIYGYSNS